VANRLFDRFARIYMTADLRSLAAGRIALALVLLLDLSKRAAQLDIFFTNEGLIPNHTLLWRPPFEKAVSLFYLASYRHEAIAGFVLCATAYLALLVGFRTRLAQIASLIAVLSLHGRLLLFDNGGDVVLGLLCVWTTFLPTGRRWSVDAVLARRAHDHPQTADLTTAPGSRAATFTSLAVMALLCQLAFIYFFNAIHKGGTSWREGSAVHYAIHLDRLATPFAVWLRHAMSPDVARALTWTTLSIEWVLPLLLLAPFDVRRCRRLAAVLVVVLHSGLGMCLNLGIFVPAMIAFTPNLLAGEDWDALARWWARRPSRTLLLERLAARAARAIERAAALLTPGRHVRITPPGAVAHKLSCWLPFGRELSVVAVITIAANQLLDENYAARKVIDHHNSPAMAAAVTYLNLFQGWSMFAPEAPMTDFNIIVEATTADGRTVDPFNEVANPRFPSPGRHIPVGLNPSALLYGYENHLPQRPAYFQALQEWILRYPERTGRATDRIVSFEVLKVEDDSPPLGEQTPSNLRWSSLFKYP
jgi:hypothetical protein